MKKVIIYALVAFFLSSCSRKESDIPEISLEISKSTSTINALKNLKTENARKISFSKHLNAEEKSFYVKYRINEAIESLKLDSKQVSCVSELFKFIKPEVYDLTVQSNLRNEFYEFERNWRFKAEQLFSKEQISYIFSSFQTFEEFKSSQKLRSAATAGGESSIDCACATKSDWCSSPTSCSLSICVFDSFGCGTLYLFDCDGLCKK